MSGSFRTAIDIGGTFTDLVTFDEASGEFRTGKVWSNPEDPSAAVDGFDELGVPAADMAAFAHATTVGVNAVVTRTGARTGLLCTRGHRDLLDMGSGLRPTESLWDLRVVRPHLARPLIPRGLRRPVTERILADGTVLVPLDLAEVEGQVAELVEAGVEGVAVVFLNSYVNPAHERAVRDLVEDRFPGLGVYTSVDLIPIFRELPRTTATAINAYVSPRVERYVDDLDRALGERKFTGHYTVMKCDGGFATAEAVRRRGIDTIHSGPVAGVSAACYLGELIGADDLLLIDIGGTTADVSIVSGGAASVSRDFQVEHDLFIGIPAVDVQSIGAGGGSIAWIDAGGALQVGPQSAGAIPGPACYGRGGRDATVTDAHLVRGTLDAHARLGGRVALDISAAHHAIEALGAGLGLTGPETANGIIEIMEMNMVGALQAISTYKGHDPRQYTLVAFGAAGPMHATALARELGVPDVVIPPWPGEFSAFGLLVSDCRVEVANGLVRPLAQLDPTEVSNLFADLERRALDQLTAQGISPDAVAFNRWLDGMYCGQARDTTCPLPRIERYDDADVAGFPDCFEAAYEQLYGIRLGMPIKTSALRVTAVGVRPRPKLSPLPAGGDDPAGAIVRTVPGTLRLDGELRTTEFAVYDRSRLTAGNRLEGPALVTQPTSTTVLLPGDQGTVDEYGNLRLSIGGR